MPKPHIYFSASTYRLNSANKTVLIPRGTSGRTPWTASLDLQPAYMQEISKGKLALQAGVFNVFNSQKGDRVQRDARLPA